MKESKWNNLEESCSVKTNSFSCSIMMLISSTRNVTDLTVIFMFWDDPVSGRWRWKKGRTQKWIFLEKYFVVGMLRTKWDFWTAVEWPAIFSYWDVVTVVDTESWPTWTVGTGIRNCTWLKTIYEWKRKSLVISYWMGVQKHKYLMCLIGILRIYPRETLEEEKWEQII